MSERVLIVGAGPAGLSVARAYREAGGRGRVTLIGAETHAPYRRPPLSKEYLRGEMARDGLALEGTDWYHEAGVELHLGVRALALDSDRRTVLTDTVGELGYDACALTTGAAPSRPDIPGIHDPAVHTFRTIEDSDRLGGLLGRGARVAVVGSGFIGCEAAASAAVRGAEVTLVSDEEAPQARRLGAEVGSLIAGWLEELGVRLRMGRPVQRIEGGGRLVLEDGGRVDFEVGVLALGISPHVALAEEGGLDLEDGRIVCDASGRSSAPGVWAASDPARLLNVAAGRRLTVEHWGEALTQGEVVGRSIAGETARWDQAPGFWSVIGERALKYVAWGDGHDEVRLAEHEGAFTAHYGQDGVCVGVLTHGRDEDHERGRDLVLRGAPMP